MPNKRFGLLAGVIAAACGVAGVAAWAVDTPAATKPAVAAAVAGTRPAGSSVDFAREVRPILSEHCFACHGPDAEARKAKLRLDTKEGVLAVRKGSAAVVPGDVEHSELYARVSTDDADEVMPPPKSGKPLGPAQVDTLKRWIEQGAAWGEHWAFAPATRPAESAVKDGRWARNPIDRFILGKLEEAKLAPAPEADRRTLARRAALDLTGLPPAPEDVEAFVNDPAPDAYERFVDKLMATPEWGEHRARYWLDAARYADTHGLHFDNYREIWPYRQWVIDAFNANVPFDRFTVEQLAGDLLPARTRDQQIASGFHRCNITTNEGGSIDDEVLASYAKDRVETTAAVWLGLTIGCASCHDHKFDPVTQKEFYQFAAFFRNTTQVAMDTNNPDTPPVLVVPAKADEPRWAEVQITAAELRTVKQKRAGEVRARFERWMKAGEAFKLRDPVDRGVELFAAALDQGQGTEVTAVILARDGAAAPAKGAEWKEGPAKGTSKALYFKDPASLAFPDAAAAFQPLDADEPMTWSAWVRIEKNGGAYTIASKLGDVAKDKMGGWKLEVRNGTPVLMLAGEKPGDAIALDLGGKRFVNENQWTHLAVTYDGGRSDQGFVCYVNGKAVTLERKADAKPKPAKTLAGKIATTQPLRLGGDGAGGNFKGGGLADVRIYQKQLTAEEVAALHRWHEVRAALTAAEAAKDQAGRDNALKGVRDLLANLYAARFDEAFAKTSIALQSADSEVRTIAARSPVTLVMQERDGSKPMAKVLFRGQYDQPREAVEPGVPKVLPPLPKDAPLNRVALAKWVVAPDNPLTARVTVNRFWQEVFGAGLVRTAEDFGNTGERPSHPELLDWLAVEFRESGWDVKRLYKLMVTSSAYRQAALTTPEKRERDPQNRLLSRGPRFRMDAEMVRDAALAASGLLVRKVGGPSVKPYQPDGIWDAVAMDGSNTRFYKRDTGEALYRRTMYWFWKRAAPPASMEIFNAPSREVCTVRRERANTPLQALVTLNDVQFVEAARNLAQRAIRHGGGDVQRRLDYVTRAVLARAFDARERGIALDSLARFRGRFDADSAAAAKLIAVGESKPDSSLSPPDLAAWTLLASQVLNLDEALNK